MAKGAAVIGAGIVGCATALTLAQAGWAVTVFDPDPPGANASFGNAGVISTGGVTPNATPAVIRDLPGMAFSSTGSGWVRRGDHLLALPWVLRMVAAARMGRVRRIADQMRVLVAPSLEAHRRLAALAGCEDLIQVRGWLKAYGTAADYAAAAVDRELMVEHGVNLMLMDADALRAHLPQVDPAALFAGVHQPDAGMATDPRALAEGYLSAATARGAVHRRESVTGLEVGGPGARVRTAGGAQDFDVVVICAGARSAGIAAWIGDRIPLIAERGYHAAFPKDAAHLIPGPTYFASHGFVLSPLAEGLRLTMGAELSRPGAAPDFRRLHQKVETARRILPALQDQPVLREWMGERPSTPDTLPVIRPSGRTPAIIHAFGHGHLGLTLAAVTAERVRDLAQRAG